MHEIGKKQQNELGNKAAQRKTKLARLAPEADKLQSIAEICPLRELSLLKAEVEDKKKPAISYYKTIEQSLIFLHS